MRVYAAVLFVALTACQKPPSQPASEKKVAPAEASPVAPVAAPAEPAITYPFQAGGRTVLASGAAGATLRWQAGLSECKTRPCPISVWLVEGEAVIDNKPVAWAASSPKMRQEEVEAGWGVGDPMGSAENVKVWASGEEEQYVGTVVRAVRMEVPGILVDQMRGFEHLRRHHELFVVNGRKLDRVWEGEEGAGPAWSSTAIVSLPDKGEGIVSYSGFRYPSPAEPDRLDITLLRWEGAGLRRQVAPVEAVVAGSFATVAAAQRARSAARDCLGAFWVLPSARVANSTGPFVLALPGATAERVRKRLEGVKKCAYNQEVQVSNLQ